MKDLFKNKLVVGLSLKKMSLNKIYYEEVNVGVSNLKPGAMSHTLGDIICYLNVGAPNAANPKFSTQDTNLFIKKGTETLAKFQIKANSTGKMNNLKFEATPVKFVGARIGKAPLNFVKMLSKLTEYSKESEYIYDDNKTVWQNFPQTTEDWMDSKGHVKAKFNSVYFTDMFKAVNESDMKVNFGGITATEFKDNMSAVLGGDKAHDANNKLMQLSFLYGLSKLSKENRDKYVTDLLYIAEKRGSKIYEFGPFGKLY
jgi:hypothetical protein